MSITIYYRQVQPKSMKALGTYTPSGTKEALCRAFGDMPIRLDNESLPVLRGMAAMDAEFSKNPNPYQELIEAIEKLGVLELSVGA